MILNRTDAIEAANVFVDYFSNFGRIDDYLRRVKLERMSNYPVSLPGMGPEDDMFVTLICIQMIWSLNVKKLVMRYS